MVTNQNDLDRPQANVSPFQYSLLTLLIITTILAMACSGLFAAPAWVGQLTGLLWIVGVAAVLTTGVIYGEGYVRTFCIGAMFPAGVCLWCASAALFSPSSPFFFGGPGRPSIIGAPLVGIFLVVFTGVTVAVGLLAVWARWLVETSRSHRGAPASGQCRDENTGKMPVTPIDDETGARDDD